MRHPALLAASISVATLLVPVVSDAQLFTLDERADGRGSRRRTRSSGSAMDVRKSRTRSSSARAVSPPRKCWAVLPGQGFRNQYADGFQVLHPEHKLAGRAFTVQFMPLRPDLEGRDQRQGEGGRHLRV